MSFSEIEYRQQKKEWNMTNMQTHNFYEIYYLLKGERNLFIDNKIFTLEENSIVIIPPFHMHKTEGGPYKRVNIYVSPDLLDENERKFLDSCASFLSFQLDKTQNNVAISLLKPFFSKIDKKDDFLRKKYSFSFVKSFLFLLQTSKLTPLFPSLESVQNDSNKNIILDIVSFINKHFNENITLELITNKFFISKNSLCKKFQQVMKCSVIEYCSAVRLNEAKHLLITTEKSVEEIADLCGYSSANYFSLLFKSKTGIAPSYYRKKK